MVSDPVLTATNLTKTYGEYTAVNGISFELGRGEILGLLGPNGAGKTTTIQMLLGLTTPDAGEITYFGRDFAKHREYCLARLNFASTYARLQGKLTVRQNLQIYAGLYGIADFPNRLKRLAEILDLTRYLDHLFWHLSSGERTRVILAKALMSKPKILLMDEPTASLDPEIVNTIIDLIQTMRKEEEISIVFTSHNMEEVTRLCDRIMFLYRGNILVTDTPLNLTKMIKRTKLNLTFEGTKTEMTKYLDGHGYAHIFVRPQLVEISLPEEMIPKVLFGITKTELFVSHIEIIRPTMEDVFVSIARKGEYALA